MKLVVTDVPVLNGEYDADFGRFTNNEGKLIKKLSGVRMGEIAEALKAGDNDLLVACAVVFLARAGKDPDMVAGVLGEADIGCLAIDTTDEDVEAEKKAEVDARPPDSPPESGSSTGTDSSVSSDEPSESSGLSTTNGSALELVTETPSGSPPLDTGATSGRAISAI